MRKKMTRMLAMMFALAIMSVAGSELQAGGGNPSTCRWCMDTPICPDWLDGNTMCDMNCLDLPEPDWYQCEEDHWTCPGTEALVVCGDNAVFDD